MNGAADSPQERRTIGTLPDSGESACILRRFAPSSGIGFYRERQSLYGFDLVTGESWLCEGNRRVELLLEQDQVEFDSSFPDFSSLTQFARQVYLRDKKHTYFALILSRGVGDSLLVFPWEYC